MAKNIEINYNNGSGYDILYPKTDIVNTVGTLPLNRGGTGKTSASSALANFIWNGSSVSSLSGSNKIGVATSTSNGGGITVTNLINYIKSNMGSSGAQIATGSYKGTNTYSETYSYSVTVGFKADIFIIGCNNGMFGLASMVKDGGSYIKGTYNNADFVILFPYIGNDYSGIYAIATITGSKSYEVDLQFTVSTSSVTWENLGGSGTGDLTGSPNISSSLLLNDNSTYTWVAFKFTP